jgi:glycosyltransferase involved in cell wall biosynthesis
LIKLAFGSVPKDGGTFTFYRNIRPELLKHGIDIRCVSVGRSQAELWEEAYVDDGCVLLAPTTRNVKKQAIAFVEWCAKLGVDMVMGINSEAILSSIPHLPENVRVLSRCANGFDHGYKISISGRERLATIIATTPRLKKDLIEKYDADPKLLRLIPNGIDPSPFEAAVSLPRGMNEVLEIGFLGRLEHKQKGVFHIPHIVKELNKRKVNFRMRVAGKGRHRSTLEQQMCDEIASGQVEFLGAITPTEVPTFLGGTDVYLFTSHFEGCPNALLEALMAGCVPASWLIEGITDHIISHGETGFIAGVGDYLAIASQIEILANDRHKLCTMGSNAAIAARERFSSKKAADSYARLLHGVMAEPPPRWTPKLWSNFRPDANFDHSWTEHLPVKLKQKIRGILD